MDFYLSSKSLKQIKEAGIEDNFELVIIDEIIQCSKFIASFISPEISKSIRNDSTMNRFFVKFPDKSEFYSTIEELKKMINRTRFLHQLKGFIEGQPIHVDKIATSEIKLKSGSIINNDNNRDTETAKLLIIFGKVLNNEEMIEGGLNLLGIKEEYIEITLDNVFELIQFSRIRGSNSNSKRFFEFLASNFYSFFNKENEKIRKNLSKLTISDFENIFKSPKFLVEDEDSLFELIILLGSNYYCLLDYIETQFLSNQNMQKLIQMINNNDIALHPLLWTSICRRLVMDPVKANNLVNPRQKCSFIFCQNGIIKHLNEVSKQNPYLAKQIDVECSKQDCGKIESLFDNSKDSHFRLANRKDSFIVFDFKSNKIKFSNYYLSVPSHNSTAYTGRPKSWRIEGSNDKINWNIIDIRQNDTNLTTWSCSCKYKCQFNTDKYYRYIRIKDIVSHNDNQEFLLSEIEFYGSLLQK